MMTFPGTHGKWQLSAKKSPIVFFSAGCWLLADDKQTRKMKISAINVPSDDGTGAANSICV